MSNKRRNRKTAKSSRHGIMGKARAQMRLAANVTEEKDWYLDTPDVRLTRIFTVVLLLHVIAVGGIIAFKMVDKASETTGIKVSAARQTLESAVQDSKELAAEVKATATAPVSDIPARHAPAVPLVPDPSKGEQYKVQTGDTLPEIAQALGVSPEALRAKNAIRSDNELYPGRWLTVPGKNEVPAPVVATAAPVKAAPAAQVKSAVTAPASTTTSVYKVKQGDTAWAISRKLNVPFNELMRINGVKNAEALQIGQELRIPGAN
jgi:LysM repeat protein